MNTPHPPSDRRHPAGNPIPPASGRPHAQNSPTPTQPKSQTAHRVCRPTRGHLALLLGIALLWDCLAGLRADTFEAEVLPPPEASAERGLYRAPFDLELSSASFEDVIRYTLDGSDPTRATAHFYSGYPIRISQTTLLRAITTRPGFSPSAPLVRSFLFP